MEIRWIEYKSKRIIYSDYRGASNETDMLRMLDDMDSLVNSDTDKKLLLTNYTGVFATDKYFSRLKELGTKNGQLIAKSALIGIVGIQNVLVKSYMFFTGQKDIKLCNNEDQAKEWIIS